MQSDGNSFCGDVVLGSFNMSYRDEDIYFKVKVCKANILEFLLWRFYILRVIDENAYLKKYST